MVPMVGTADEARDIVACTRYPPQGRRGAAFGFAHDDYEGGDVAAKIAALHARTMVIAQIETDAGLANVEAIAAVPGIDALWVGQFDLTNFMGIPGQFPHPGLLGRARSRRRCLRGARQDAPRCSPPTTTGHATTPAKGFRLMALRHRPAAAAGGARPRPRRPARGDATEGRDDDAEPIARRPHARHPRLPRRARVRPARRSRFSTARRASSGNICRRSFRAINADHAARYDALYVNTAARARPPRSRAPIAGSTSSRATASATTPSTCRR